MEINSLTSRSRENKINKKIGTKTKFLYKFKILNDSPQANKYMGKCYLVNINSPLKKTFSVEKNKNKLPPIMIKETNNKLLNTISLSEDRKLKDSIHYQLNSDRGKRFPIQNNISSSVRRLNNTDKNMPNHNSSVTLTEAQRIKDRKAAYEEILKKINERFFLKKATVQYLTSLFFGPYETRDIKYVNLSKIKDKKEKEKEMHNYRYNQNEKTNNLFKNNLVCQRKHDLYDNSKEKQSGLYKLNKSYVDERLKYFRNSKIRKVKNRVNQAINDLMKNRKKNLYLFDSMRKSCDYKYDDLGFVNYCDEL